MRTTPSGRSTSEAMSTTVDGAPGKLQHGDVLRSEAAGDGDRAEVAVTVATKSKASPECRVRP